jgi:hypothetical protein
VGEWPAELPDVDSLKSKDGLCRNSDDREYWCSQDEWSDASKVVPSDGLRGVRLAAERWRLKGDQNSHWAGRECSNTRDAWQVSLPDV